jgi:AcrR family transcriptional regulator
VHSGGSTKRADATANRTRILKVAQSVFAERGLELEMNEVAAQAHLGVGTLYGHFANRDDLLRAIIQQVVADAFAQLQAAQSEHEDDSRAALQALVFAGLQVQQQYQHLFAVIRDPRLATLLDPSYGQATRIQFLEIPRGLIDRGIRAGIFRRDLDQDMAAVTIVGAFNIVVDLLGMGDSLEKLAQRLSQFLLTMLSEKAEE